MIISESWISLCLRVQDYVSSYYVKHELLLIDRECQWVEDLGMNPYKHVFKKSRTPALGLHAILTPMLSPELAAWH